MIENASRQFFLVLLTIVAALACVLTLKVPLGPDLKGGTQLIYDVPKQVLDQLKTKENVSADAVMDQTVTVIRERIDPTGSLDPLITRSGDTGILIELPWFEDPQELKRVLERISNLGRLEMRIVAYDDFQKENVRFNLKTEATRLENWLKQPDNKEAIDKDPRNIRRYNEDPAGPLAFPNLAWYPRLIRPDSKDPTRWDLPYGAIPGLQQATFKFFDDAQWNNGIVPEAMQQKQPKDRYLVEFLALNMKEISFSGKDLDPTGVGVGQSRSGGLGVNYAIVPALQGDYAKWSEEYIGKCSAIVLNDIVKSAPVFRGKIPGVGIIEGDFTRDEVEELVKVLRTGSLRVEPELLSKQQIGATLGIEAIKRGVFSMLAGALLVFAFMLYYYGIAGTIACVTLLLNVFLLYAAMMFMQATITLPGLGGIVLTLGMAVDANVLIYERIREELHKGKAMLQAVRAGFERAMSAILDSNITTFLIGLVLFNVGVGPVRGFAVTLMVGIVTTVFTQFFVTRLLFHYALERKMLDNYRTRNFLDDRNVDFVRYIKVCLAGSAGVILFGLIYAALYVPRQVALGIDFTGGANLRMVLAEPTSAANVRARLANDAEFGKDYPYATVNTVEAIEGDVSTQFNVRLKLNETQRGEIDAERQQARERREAAQRDNLPPPPAYEPPYVVQLRRVFADTLVEPAFSTAMLTPHADRDNLQYAQIDVHFQQPVPVAEAREKLGKALQQSVITPLPDANATEARNLRIEWTTQKSTREWQLPELVDDAIAGITDVRGKQVVLSEPFPEAQEIQGRLVNDLRNAAIGALILAWVLIVFYLRVRFHEYKFGIGAVVALIHDVLVAFTAVVVCNHLGLVHAEIGLSMIAAFLTIIGYSVNDTIIVYDRIRENRLENARNGVDEPLRSLINRSLNQTLSRTVLTTVLTLFVVIAQFAVNWGSESDLESFAFAMIVGMCSGVYSTIYIAAPILIWLDKGTPPAVPDTSHPVEASTVRQQA